MLCDPYLVAWVLCLLICDHRRHLWTNWFGGLGGGVITSVARKTQRSQERQGRKIHHDGTTQTTQSLFFASFAPWRLCAARRREFWIFGPPWKNTIHRSKNHLHCHPLFAEVLKNKPFATRACAKRPRIRAGWGKFQKSGPPGWHCSGKVTGGWLLSPSRNPRGNRVKRVCSRRR